jgi:hypothetical protein
MKDKIQVDIGIGDIVKPLIQEIQFVRYRGKPFFENAISLLVYPIETIFSEKLETILSKGVSNSRMKDYHDLILLIRNKDTLNLDRLEGAIEKTFSNRGTLFRQIEFEENALKVIQKLWTSHLYSLGNNAQDLNLPKDISTVIEEINNYAMVINQVLKTEIGN